MSFLSQPLQSILISASRVIGTIEVDVIITENTVDALEITQHPVQQGATIADHAFKKPVTLSMQVIMSSQASLLLPVDLSVIYQKFLSLQNSRVPFTVLTPKRTYSNMLISALGLTTDKRTENNLSITVGMQEVIIVPIGVTTVPASAQRTPQKTAATTAAGNNSGILTGVQAITKVAQ